MAVCDILLAAIFTMGYRLVKWHNENKSVLWLIIRSGSYRIQGIVTGDREYVKERRKESYTILSKR